MAVEQKKLIDITLLGKYDAKIKTYVGTAETGLNTKIGTLPAKVGEENVADVIDYIDKKIALVNGDASALEGRVAANETAIGKKKNGEEAATGLYLYVDNAAQAAVDAVVAGASESFDTLKEIADWIANDESGAAKMASDITALQGSASDTSASVSIVGVKKYAEEKVAGKNVSAEGETGDNALLTASAASNKVTVASTQKLKDAVTRAEGAVLSLGKATSTETYVSITVTDGDNATVKIDDSVLNTKIGAAKNGETAATGMYADIQGATNQTVKGLEDKVGAVPESVGETATGTVIAYADAKSASDVKAVQGNTTSTVAGVEEKVDALVLAAESDINGLFSAE